MSLAYCYFCLDRIDTDNPSCKNHGDKIIYGEKRVNYLQGYRDALSTPPAEEGGENMKIIKKEKGLYTFTSQGLKFIFNIITISLILVVLGLLLGKLKFNL